MKKKNSKSEENLNYIELKENKVITEDSKSSLSDEELKKQFSTTQKKIAVELNNVYYKVETETILEDINIKVPLQSCVVILGISGSGKSTLLKSMSGILFPHSGKVRIFDKEIYNLFQRERLYFMYENLAFVFQDGGLINNLSVYENLQLPLSYYGKLNKSDINKIIDETMSRFNIESIKYKYPGRLSLGQKKFVGLARAFALDPKILFLDEPTTSIDIESAEKIINMVRSFIILGGTVVAVTSDMLFANSISSIMGIIDYGKIIEYDTPSKIKISKKKQTKKVIKNIYKEADLADEILKLIS